MASPTAAAPPVLVLLVLGGLGCAGERGADLPAQLRSCGLVTEGDLPYPPFYAPTECYEACLGEASCEALEQALCRTDVQLLRDCDGRCAFACASGALIAVELVCDGVEHCEGGDDERECPAYRCDDGQELVGDKHRCDGRVACADGSDEAACPMFLCDDGEAVARGARCDGWAQCADASDEADCAEVVRACDG